ncbi:MAG TPA: hypothetical protein VFW40_00890 [Capsulimonadaceae bacterium]|nr:hypothetical protein [Capsulimonadaceae bacterium]
MIIRSLMCVALLVFTLAPAFAQSPAPATSKISASTTEVAAARARLLNLIRTKPDTAPSPDLFTNRSAARMAVCIYAELGMLKNIDRGEKGSNKVRSRRIVRQIDALGTKYGLNKRSYSREEIERLESQGTHLYSDILGLMAQPAARDSSRALHQHHHPG